MRIMGGDSGTNLTGDTIIPDDEAASASNISGGPGARSTARRSVAGFGTTSGSSSASGPAIGGRAKRKEEGRQRKVRKDKAWAATDALLQRLSTLVDTETKNNTGTSGTVSCEERVRLLAMKVDSLIGQIQQAKSAETRNVFEELLGLARDELHEAWGEMRANLAARKLAADKGS